MITNLLRTGDKVRVRATGECGVVYDQRRECPYTEGTLDRCVHQYGPTPRRFINDQWVWILPNRESDILLVQPRGLLERAEFEFRNRYRSYYGL